MGNKKETITQALGIKDEWKDTVNELLNEGLGKNKTVSDLLAYLGESVREEELGKIDISLTEYEKKLILMGYFAGTTLAQKPDPISLLGAAIFGGMMRGEEEDGKEG